MTLLEAINASAEDMRNRLEEHRRLLAAAIQEGVTELESCVVECPRNRVLREALGDAVRVLEETRKAFKSKRLEALRKKLTGVLAETL